MENTPQQSPDCSAASRPNDGGDDDDDDDDDDDGGGGGGGDDDDITRASRAASARCSRNGLPVLLYAHHPPGGFGAIPASMPAN